MKQESLEQLYQQHGLILLRGFHLDVNEFKSFVETLCSSSVFNASGNRDTVDESANIQTVNLGQAPFAHHPELAREPGSRTRAFLPAYRRHLSTVKL